MDVRIDNLTKNKNLIESESINKTREQELNKELFDNKQIINEINIEGKEKTVPDSRHEQDLELIEKKMPPVYNRPFTGELSRAIGQLANDRGKKSEYFAPVSELAHKLLTDNLDVKDRADILSQLLEKAAYYLNNRGSSIFSRQRGRRRAACESLLSGAVKFLSDAPMEFWSPINEKVRQLSLNDTKEKKNPEAKVIREKLGYFLTEDFRNAAEAKEHLKNEFSKNKNKEVFDIYNRTEGLHALLTNRMPPYPKPEADTEKMRAFEREIFETGIVISDYYRKLTESCKKALDNSALDDQTKKAIEAIKNDAEHMGKVFANGIGDFLEGNKPDEDTTWQEALARKSTVIAQLRDESVEKMGMGTSVVYKLKIGNKTKYFKKDELMARDYQEAWSSIVEKAHEYQYYKEEYKEILGKLGTELGKELKDKKFYYEVVVGLLRGENKNAILDAHKMSADLIEKHPFLKALKDTYGNKNFTEYAKELLSDYLKKANAYILATKNAKIDAGKNLSNRNVATYRMASMMGISRLVVRSDTADVYDGEERIQGMMMEEAQGETAAKHHNHGKEYYLKYTDDTVSDIITMQIFDYICGQVDRNNTNYFLTEMDGQLINLKMIDNDMAMGRLLPKNIQKKVLQLRVPDLRAIRAMPQATKERIIEIAKNGKEYLKFFLGDILDSQEIEAAYLRLKYISDKIEDDDKELSELKKIPISELTDEKKKNRMEQELSRKPELQPIFYMYSLYKAAQELYYKNKVNNKSLVSYCEEYIKDHSYLNLDHMPIFEDLKRTIEDERKKWENEKTSKVPE